MWPELHFLRPLWLLALVPLALLLWRLARTGGAGDAWRGVVDTHLLGHLLEGAQGRVRRLPLVLLALGWLLGVLALAGPVWERLPQPLYQREAFRVIVLDISPSMNAADLPPSRLTRARFEVLDLLARAREGQTALIAFGPEPFVVSPLTNDARTIAAQVPLLETDLLPVQGDKRTDLALALAGRLLEGAAAPEGDIILVTDDLPDSAAARAEAERLREQGYRLSVLGVGTEGGAPVPWAEGGFATDAQGGVALSRLEPERLRALADTGGGRYVPLSPGDADAQALIPPDGGRLAGGKEDRDVRADQWREEGPWLLLLLLPLAALAFRRGWLSPLVLVVLVAPHPPAEALSWGDLWLRPDQQAARAFEQGDPVAAAERFERRDWRAAAEYQAGDYDQVLETLQGLEDPESAYNRGNALARLGEYEDAIARYEEVLAEDPDHADARHNRDLLRRLLEQQQQQEEQNQRQEQRREEQDQGQSESGQGESGESESRQDESGSDQNQAGQDRSHQQDQAEAEGDQGSRGQNDQGEGSQDQSQASSGAGKQDSDQERAEARAGEAEPQADSGARQAGAESGEQDKQRQEEPRPAAGGAEDPQDAQTQAEAGRPPMASRGDAEEQAGAEPGIQDLLGERQASSQPRVAPTESTQGGEDRQAMEHMLRRVPDDPGGLLRQRFLLQHLRRSGRLP